MKDKESDMKESTQRVPVLVTTAHRGVFFGLADPQQKTARTIELTHCRNAIYWSGTKGFLGLAAHGPGPGSRIGAVAPRVLLHDVTSVSECSPEAATVWEEWS